MGGVGEGFSQGLVMWHFIEKASWLSSFLRDSFFSYVIRLLERLGNSTVF